MRKEDACGSDCGCESPLKTGQHRNINNAQYTKGAKNPEKLHATASIEEANHLFFREALFQGIDIFRYSAVAYAPERAVLQQ